MPIKVAFGFGGTTIEGFAAAIDFAWQNGAHVISNSWGYHSDNPNFVPAIVAAINRAVTQGRGGLGSVVVFSASNTARRSVGVQGAVSFPSNVQINGVLTVGASDRDDFQSDYSPMSNAASPNNQIIDIVAPSHRAYPPEAYIPEIGGIPGEGFEVWTIDIPGNNGYNQWNNANFPRVAPAFGEILPNFGVNNLSYTGRFGGTSASCPVVAGVAALLLSVNNTLTQQQVFNILTQSADRVGGYAYNANGWSPELGNGRLNACATLSRIPNRYSINGVDAFCNSATYSITGLPVGSTSTWASSNTAIATISPSGLASKVSDGIVAFTASINIPNRCGISFSTKSNIIVGAPLPPSISPYNYDVQCGTFLEAYCTEPAGANGYRWNLNFGQVIQDQNGAYTNYFYTAPLISNPQQGQRYFNYLTVQAKNICGLSAPSQTLQFTVGPVPSSCSGGGGGPILLRVSPNPTSNNLTIETIDNSEFTKLRIVDKMGQMKKQFNYSPSKKVTLNVSDLPADVYRIQALINNNWTTVSFIKQ